MKFQMMLKKRISNIESWISNVEGRNSIDFYKLKRQSVAIPSFEILRSCGSLFSLAAGFQSGQFNHQEIVPFWRSACRLGCAVGVT
jgi:hypothetical protein